MTRIIFVTQVLDAADPVLGASADLARALGARCDRLAAVANEVGACPPIWTPRSSPSGKKKGPSRALRVLRYQLAVTQLAKRLPADAQLAHCAPGEG